MKKEHIDEVLEVIKVANDGEATQARLKELGAQIEALEAKRKAADDEQRFLARTKADLAKQREGLIEEQTRLASLSGQLDDRAEALDAKDLKVHGREAKAQAAEREADEKLARAQTAEREAGDKLSEAKRVMAEAVAMRDDYRERLKQFKELAA